jgi:hypothetical protein
LSTQIADDTPEDESLTRLGDALEELGRADAPLAELVNLKYFCGLSFARSRAARCLERTISATGARRGCCTRSVTEG